MSSEVADREELLLYSRGPGGTRHRESNVTFTEGQKQKSNEKKRNKDEGESMMTQD